VTEQLPPAMVIPRALGTIEAVWEETLDPPRAPGGGGGGGKPESKSPLPDGVLDARREALAVLGSWVSLVAMDRGRCLAAHDGVRHVGGGAAVCLRRQHELRGQDGVALAAWLAGHASWLAEHEVGPVCALELVEQAKALDRIAYPDRPDALFFGRCPVGTEVGTPCGRRLYWPTGELTVDCPSCGTRDDVRGWVKRMADDLPDELTSGQLATYLTRRTNREITPNLIRQWVHKGRLSSIGKDDRHRPLYSATAAVASCEWWMERSQRAPRRVA
jgi:hypothetical protein